MNLGNFQKFQKRPAGASIYRGADSDISGPKNSEKIAVCSPRIDAILVQNRNDLKKCPRRFAQRGRFKPKVARLFGLGTPPEATNRGAKLFQKINFSDFPGFLSNFRGGQTASENFVLI